MLWSSLLPRRMRPSPKAKERSISPPIQLDAETPRIIDNFSILTVNAFTNESCMLLQRLPLEVRLTIYSHVIGNDRFRIITVPWKVVAVPDTADNVSMAQRYFQPPVFHTAVPNKTSPIHGIGLLISCRQIYQEAINLMYSTNTFIFLDFQSLETFVRSIPPTRLNTIRHLEIRYSPESSIAYQHPRTSHYDLPICLNQYWGLVANMQSLRSLFIRLEAYSQSQPWQQFDEFDLCENETKRLEGLLRVRGLSTFQLEMAYLQGDSTRTEPYVPALRKAIMESVTKPREARELPQSLRNSSATFYEVISEDL